jgi:GNAT superfamily N-acetyltransferase
MPRSYPTPPAGLCATCRHGRWLGNDRGSQFLRCAQGDLAAGWPRYPRLPVMACDRYDAHEALRTMPAMPQPHAPAIRPATPDDVALVLDLIRQLAAYERSLHLVENTEDLLRDVLFGPRAAAECVIADMDGAAVGFALYFQNYSTFKGRPGLYLEDLFVVPEARGRGVGEALLRHLAGVAVARNYGRMEWAVLDWNAPAIAFYKRLGAVAMDEWSVFRVTGEALSALSRPREDA